LRRKIKIGDLICYNAAGSKDKTLGLVLGFKPPQISQNYVCILVQWCVISEYMPRKEWGYWTGEDYTTGTQKVSAGEFAWHKFGSWFEIAPDSK
tara:strand:+ start:749 stop:1030 length:282 start_codon:yes stop_codon:yes gene_type:complete